MTFVTESNGKNKNTYNPNDCIMTPRHIAKRIIDSLPINNYDTVLDPFKGEGAFYDQYPETMNKHWCEIKDGKDFFDFQEQVDWIISNPPYSKFTEVMQHSYEIADNIVYLIPLNKIVSSWGRCLDLDNYGGVKKIWIFPAGKANFPFGFPACAVWIQKGYKGAIETELWKDL
ncbi:MAG: hypothetical protein UIC65_00445 [Alphaproteobacteria bacterium]|nr:hypothetical protein [Alphaproteobacteria bacterium]